MISYIWPGHQISSVSCMSNLSPILKLVMRLFYVHSLLSFYLVIIVSFYSCSFFSSSISELYWFWMCISILLYIIFWRFLHYPKSHLFKLVLQRGHSYIYIKNFLFCLNIKEYNIYRYNLRRLIIDFHLYIFGRSSDHILYLLYVRVLPYKLNN